MAENRIPMLSRRTLESGLVIIDLSGDLDAHGTREIESAFGVAMSDRTQQTVINLHGVTFLGSAALAMLAAHAQFSRRGGGIFVLADAQPRVSDVINQSGFGDVLGYYPSLEDAISALENS
jgi:anti-sigma B factor antagonist